MLERQENVMPGETMQTQTKTQIVDAKSLGGYGGMVRTGGNPGNKGGGRHSKLITSMAAEIALRGTDRLLELVEHGTFEGNPVSPHMWLQAWRDAANLGADRTKESVSINISIEAGQVLAAFKVELDAAVASNQITPDAVAALIGRVKERIEGDALGSVEPE